MNNLQFIYFDVGNTLVDCSTAFQNAAIKFDLTKDDIGKVFDENHDAITKGIMSADEFWKICIQKFNLQGAENFNFLESWISDYKPVFQMHDLVYKLKSSYRIGLLSNIYKGMFPHLIKKKLIPNIDYGAIIFSCDVGMMKQNLNIYKLAQEKAGVEAGSILLIDDRQDFLAVAKKMSWQTFWFDNKQLEKSVQELQEFLETTVQR